MFCRSDDMSYECVGLFVLVLVSLTNVITTSQSRMLLAQVASKSASKSSIEWTKKCPCKCDADELGRKRMICDEGGRTSIPTNRMDVQAQILIFTAPSDKPNVVTLGRIFLEMKNLQEIYIMHSNVPAIGDSSFWPGKKVTILDLSHNKITLLRDSDFNGLINLDLINLSDNQIEGSPSAPFRFLTNLTTLLLARNKLTKLVPRLFYKLEKLEHLDLSGNPIEEIDHDDFKDLKPLRTLTLSGCNLKHLHSLVYQSLPNLEELDLKENKFQYIGSEEFKHLRKLKILRLDGNKLVTLDDNTFYGHKLNLVSMSHNEFTSFSSCAFCNASIKQLDISNNKLTAFQSHLTEPLSDSLSILYAENNRLLTDPSTSVLNLVRPLKVLRIVSLASMGIEDTIPSHLFWNQRETLTSINLSGNKFINISSKLFEGLKRLEELDLSENALYAIPETMLETLDSLTSLSVLYLHSNPWSCFRCHILPLLQWIRTSPPAYTNACLKEGKGFCVTCSYPGELAFKQLHLLEDWDLEWCADPTIQMRLTTTEPNVGLILALLIIISLVIVIIAVVIMYRKQGATYYTHEDEQRFDDKSVFNVSKAVQQFANATATPPMSPDSPTSTPILPSPPASPTLPTSPLSDKASCSSSHSRSTQSQRTSPPSSQSSTHSSSQPSLCTPPSPPAPLSSSASESDTQTKTPKSAQETQPKLPL